MSSWEIKAIKLSLPEITENCIYETGCLLYILILEKRDRKKIWAFAKLESWHFEDLSVSSSRTSACTDSTWRFRVTRLRENHFLLLISFFSPMICSCQPVSAQRYGGSGGGVADILCGSRGPTCFIVATVMAAPVSSIPHRFVTRSCNCGTLQASGIQKEGKDVLWMSSVPTPPLCMCMRDAHGKPVGRARGCWGVAPVRDVTGLWRSKPLLVVIELFVSAMAM